MLPQRITFHTQRQPVLTKQGGRLRGQHAALEHRDGRSQQRADLVPLLPASSACGRGGERGTISPAQPAMQLLLSAFPAKINPVYVQLHHLSLTFADEEGLALCCVPRPPRPPHHLQVRRTGHGANALRGRGEERGAVETTGGERAGMVQSL